MTPDPMHQARTSTLPKTFIRRKSDGKLFIASHSRGYGEAGILASILSNSIGWYFVPVTVRGGWFRRWRYILHDDRAWTDAESGDFEIVREDVKPREAYKLRLAHKEPGVSL